MSQGKARRYKTFGKCRSLRLAGWDYATPCPYHVVISTHAQDPLFADPLYAGAFVDALRERTALNHYTIHAFCVMPDHVHLCCQPDIQTPISLLPFIQHLKRRTVLRLRKLGVQGLVWQRGFYDRILRREEQLPAVIDYILNNPIRAELVDDFCAYPFSYALEVKAYTGLRDVVDVDGLYRRS